MMSKFCAQFIVTHFKTPSCVGILTDFQFAFSKQPSSFSSSFIINARSTHKDGASLRCSDYPKCRIVSCQGLGGGSWLPIYISFESIPPCRVMWTGHGIETSIPTTRKDRSLHHTTLCTTIEDWELWRKVDGLMFSTLFILLKSSKELILLLRLLNHSDALLPHWNQSIPAKNKLASLVHAKALSEILKTHFSLTHRAMTCYWI